MHSTNVSYIIESSFIELQNHAAAEIAKSFKLVVVWGKLVLRKDNIFTQFHDTLKKVFSKS